MTSPSLYISAYKKQALMTPKDGLSAPFLRQPYEISLKGLSLPKGECPFKKESVLQKGPKKGRPYLKQFEEVTGSLGKGQEEGQKGQERRGRRP